MDESHERDERLSQRQQAEGVRIIRADEAQAALDAGQATGRRPDDEPRFGDVPPSPEGPRPQHRFPLPDSVDPASAVPRPAVRPPERRFGRKAKPAETQHPPTEPRVVRLLASDPDQAAPASTEHRHEDAWDGWTTDTLPRTARQEPVSVGASREGPRHFARSTSVSVEADRVSPPPSFAAPSDGRHFGGSDPSGGVGASGRGPVEAGTAGAGTAGAGTAGTGTAGRGMGIRASTAAASSGGWPPDPSEGGVAPPGGGGTSSASTGYSYSNSLDSPASSSSGGDPYSPPDLAPPQQGINLSSGSMPELQHWTDPPTGEVPFVLPDREPSQGEELAAWQALGSRGLRWRDEASDWDDLDDVGELAGDEPRLGALDTTRSEHSDMFSFDEQFERLGDQRSGSSPVLDLPEEEPPPVPTQAVSTRRPVSRSGPARSGSHNRPGGQRSANGRVPAGGGRDLKSAATVGVGLVLVLAVAYAIGSVALMLLSAAVVTASVLELYNVIQHRGFRPATLLGVSATVAVMLAGYGRWGEAVPLITVLVLVVSMLWYMFGVVEARPVVNVGLTVMAFVWVGVLGSYASLLLSVHDGKQLFLLPILVTVAADIAAYFAGSSMGSRPLAPHISPGKTWEGVIGGGLGAIVVSLVLSRLPFLSKVWSAKHAILLAVVIAIVAPLGDLCESMVKRDLDLKDSGSLLPGHGGLLDRFDAVLFVLPATYYLLHYLKMV